MADKVMVQVRFSEKRNINGHELEYQDALYFTQSEFASKTQADIDAMKNKRADDWKNSIENSPPSREPTKAELQAAINELDIQKADLTEKIKGAK